MRLDNQENCPIGGAWRIGIESLGFRGRDTLHTNLIKNVMVFSDCRA